MSVYRENLSQLQGKQLLTDGGLETTLIFHHDINLPYFASFPLLRETEGRQQLNVYWDRYAQLAMNLGMGLILESPTWRKP